MDDTLNKLNEAIGFCDNTDTLEANVQLSYAELNYIRRLIMTDNYANELAVDNLRKASRKSVLSDACEDHLGL